VEFLGTPPPPPGGAGGPGPLGLRESIAEGLYLIYKSGVGNGVRTTGTELLEG
jgi:hypothetical protein